MKKKLLTLRSSLLLLGGILVMALTVVVVGRIHTAFGKRIVFGIMEE